MKYQITVNNDFALCKVTVEFTDHEPDMPLVYKTIDEARKAVSKILHALDPMGNPAMPETGVFGVD